MKIADKINMERTVIEYVMKIGKRKDEQIK